MPALEQALLTTENNVCLQQTLRMTQTLLSQQP